MASLKRSTSQSLSVDQKAYSRPGSTSSLGTVNITIQPPVSDLGAIVGMGLMWGIVATGVEQLCGDRVQQAATSTEPSRRGPADSTSGTRGRWREDGEHDSDGSARRGAATWVRAGDANDEHELHGGRGAASAVDGGDVPQQASVWGGYPAAIGTRWR